MQMALYFLALISNLDQIAQREKVVEMYFLPPKEGDEKKMVEADCRIKGLDLASLSTEELKYLYQEAVTFGLLVQEDILKMGAEKETGTYFLLEKYDFLLKSGAKPKKLKTLKEEIIKRDPHNQEGSRLTLALYQYKEKGDIKYLQRYLKKFGAEDPETASCLQLLIQRNTK